MQSFPGANWLIFEVGRRVAEAWFVGPALTLFCWILVPIQRARLDVLNGGDEPEGAGFWWAPGWGFLGIVGVGLSLAASPILDPGLADAWTPFLWVGATADLSLSAYALLVLAGLAAIIKGLLLYAHAWAMDRSIRYRAWRFHHVFRPRR